MRYGIVVYVLGLVFIGALNSNSGFAAEVPEEEVSEDGSPRKKSKVGESIENPNPALKPLSFPENCGGSRLVAKEGSAESTSQKIDYAQEIKTAIQNMDLGYISDRLASIQDELFSSESPVIPVPVLSPEAKENSNAPRVSKRVANNWVYKAFDKIKWDTTCSLCKQPRAGTKVVDNVVVGKGSPRRDGINRLGSFAITACGSTFCNDCLEKAREPLAMRKTCPGCKGKLTNQGIYIINPDPDPMVVRRQ